jgi:hypothetical protein
MRIALSLVTLALVAVVATGEEQVDNPRYKSWATYKVGTTIKLRTTCTEFVKGKEVDTKTVLMMTVTLKEVTPEKVVVEVITEAVTKTRKITPPPQKQEIPAKISLEAATQPAGVLPGMTATKKGEGDEEMTVAGKTFKAHWVEVQINGPDAKGTTKAWTSDEVPGLVLKAVVKMTRPERTTVTLELVDFKPAE